MTVSSRSALRTWVHTHPKMAPGLVAGTSCPGGGCTGFQPRACIGEFSSGAMTLQNRSRIASRRRHGGKAASLRIPQPARDPRSKTENTSASSVTMLRSTTSVGERATTDHTDRTDKSNQPSNHVTPRSLLACPASAAGPLIRVVRIIRIFHILQIIRAHRVIRGQKHPH